jgi:uroporphyrinogen-III decarboxylase
MQVEITLQPWHAFKPDGVVLFSDILTPLAGMNIPFDIGSGNGPVIFEPIRTMEQVGQGASCEEGGEDKYQCEDVLWKRRVKMPLVCNG